MMENMKNKDMNVRRVLTIFVTGVVLLICLFILSIMLVVILTPAEKMTIEKAQTRTPFAICLPTYLPENVNPDANVKADFSNTVEVEISLIYKGFDNEDTLVEIVQTYVPNSHTPDFAGKDREPSVRALIAWVVGWPNVDTYRDKTKVSANTYIENEQEYGTFEIVFPSTIQANVVSWKKFPVFYQVYSYLSLSEAQAIAGSLTNCNSVPRGTQ